MKQFIPLDKVDQFVSMLNVYENSMTALEALKENGHKLVLCMGADVPEELIIAAGFTPIRIQGNPNIPLETADKFLEYAFNPVVRSQFQQIADGSYGKLLDRIVISNSTDVLVRIYYYLREMRRIGMSDIVPPVYFFDFLFTRRRMNQEYNYDRMKKFKETVESWSGKEITDDELENAIKICNENRLLLERVTKLRLENKISGSDSLAIYGSSLLMPKETHNTLLRELLHKIEDMTEIQSPETPRIMLIGSVHEDNTLYKILE